jgi:hypothetical protein
VVTSGELPLIEAVSQLMTLHEDCLRRVRRNVSGFRTTAAHLRGDAIGTRLLEELAGFYGVAVEDVTEGFAHRDDPGSDARAEDQPHRPDGSLDVDTLRAEAAALLAAHGWSERQGEVEAFATPYDPRLGLVRSRVALADEGLAWVSLRRPQNFQVALFAGLRLIHRQTGQWCLEFRDWRRRRLTEPHESAVWLDFLDRLRQASSTAGFGWPCPDRGGPWMPDDVVIYNVAGWSSEDRAGLGRALAEAAIPHDWDGSDLRIPSAYEARVDRIIERR